MAMNLRLPPDTAEALRERAAKSGRSQQELIREAVDAYLGLGPEAAPFRGSIDDLVTRGLARRPAVPYREATRMIALDHGVTSLDLLQREERF
jgi:plasmid stability protein